VPGLRNGSRAPSDFRRSTCYTRAILAETGSTTLPKGILRARLALLIVTLLALWFVLCRQLSGEWTVNEQYSYGWFVPFFALFLFWLRWEDRPETGGKGPAIGKQGLIALVIGAVALLLLLPIRLFEVANPDWRPISWLHACAVITITFTALYLAGGRPWLKHFAFPILFFLIAVPWISPIEEPIVQGLMRMVAAVATETITLFGIPAQLEGNLIRIDTGLVGVNEACSGVRSLQTSLMIGLLFGELKRLSTSKRLLLLLGALGIAVVANFGRAFFLVWVAATQNVAAVEEWHDAAGYTIVALVFCGSLGLAALLGRGRQKGGRRKAEVGNGGQRSEVEDQANSFRFILPPSSFILSIAWLLAVEIGVEAWYRMHEQGLMAREQWSARWPEAAKDFRSINLDERTRRILRFDEGRGAMWRVPSQRPEVGRPEDSALLYFFRWRPGGNSALLANLHRPDVCLPAAGWIQAGDYGVRVYSVSEKFSLPFRHFLFAQRSGNSLRQRFAHAFYCLREDRVRGERETLPEQFAQEPSEWSRRERFRLVAQGRRHLGQQVMEFVLVTPNELRPEEAEGQFARALPELVEVESRK
jgi:exosortase